MMLCRIVLSLVLFSWSAQGFFVPGGQHHTPTVLKAAKGFGAKETPTTPKKKKQETSPVPAEPASSSNDSLISNPLTDSFTSQEQTQDLSQGNKLLEEMRRGRAEQRNAELRKVKEVQEVDAMLRESPEAAVIPEKVAQRMGKRLLPFVGIPLIGGMGAFVGFWYMATYRDLEFEPSLVAGTTIGLLVVGLVGITYSLMSASWDEDREGSMLGTDEFSKNIENIKSGLSRSRENAVLRDRMSEFSPEELASLDSKEAAKEKRTQSFSDKFGDDLE